MPQQHFVLKPYCDQELYDELKEGSIDFLIAPAMMIQDVQTAYNFSRIASLNSLDNVLDGSMSDAGVLIVPSTSSVKSIDDIQGYTLWASSPKDFSGLSALKIELNQHRDSIENHFSTIKYTGNPADAVLYRIRDSENVAGIVPICVFEDMVNELFISASDYRVLNPAIGSPMRCQHTTPLFPSWGFAVHKSVSVPLYDRVLTALLSIQASSVMARDSQSRGWSLPDHEQQLERYSQTLSKIFTNPLRQFFNWMIVHQSFAWTFLLGLCILVAYHIHLHWRFSKAQKQILALHDELARKREEIEKKHHQALVGELGSSLAHEMNQPLECIMNYARGLSLMIAPLPNNEKLIKALKATEREVHRASSVLKRMRAIIRQGHSIELTTSSPFEVMDQTIEIFSEALTLGNVTLVHNRTGDSLLRLPMDTIGFQQILVNAFKNSIEAFKDAKTSMPLITITETIEKHQYSLTICDNGPGLPVNYPKDLSAFFTTKENGMGLGLPLCRQIAEQLNGAFSIRNIDEGSGVCISLWFPFKES